LLASFTERMQAEIDRRLVGVKEGERVFIRIHDSGDFYSEPYARKWFAIAAANPRILFYAYTKMIPLFRRLAGDVPENLSLIFSEGGKADHLIDQSRDRHARVFFSADCLESSGYADASHDDAVAVGQSHRIGLVYHGAKSTVWVTSGG
jgi:hypothetical protein